MKVSQVASLFAICAMHGTPRQEWDKVAPFWSADSARKLGDKGFLDDVRSSVAKTITEFVVGGILIRSAFVLKEIIAKAVREYQLRTAALPAQYFMESWFMSLSKELWQNPNMSGYDATPMYALFRDACITAWMNCPVPPLDYPHIVLGNALGSLRSSIMEHRRLFKYEFPDEVDYDSSHHDPLLEIQARIDKILKTRKYCEWLSKNRMKRFAEILHRDHPEYKVDISAIERRALEFRDLNSAIESSKK